MTTKGCELSNASCSESRGGIFAPNLSLTYIPVGIYRLPTFEEAYVGQSGYADTAIDTVQFTPSNGANNISVKKQCVSGIADESFWHGTFPLSPRRVQLTSPSRDYPSLLQSLVDESIIPSLSWAYTAGAYYHDPPAFVSLTLGGYDRKRIAGSSLQIPFSSVSENRDLVVEVRSMSYNEFGSSPLLTTPIPSFIDSLVPQIWLPLSVCQNFERALNLTWDEHTELYLVDDATRTNLLSRDLNFTFSLGAVGTGNTTVEVTLPYAAFDLQMTPPAVNTTSRYFPLKRAANESQSILGRVFLQEAYVVADYGWKNFTIAQAAFPRNDDEPDLVTISLPLADGRKDSATANGVYLSKGAIAGTVIAAVAVVVLGAGIVYFVLRRRRKGDEAVKVRTNSLEWPAEANGRDVFGVAEVATEDHGVHEVDSSFGAGPELSAKGGTVGRHEMSGEGLLSELEGSDLQEVKPK